MLNQFKKFWKAYRFRFTPWQALNFNRHAVSVKEQHRVESLDIQDDKLLLQLQSLFDEFRPPEYVWMFRDCVERRREFLLSHDVNKDVLFRKWGFELSVRPSCISGAGKGVFVERGSIRRGQIVALYPGTVYLPFQPIL
jgi:hypothetical protein